MEKEKRDEHGAEDPKDTKPPARPKPQTQEQDPPDQDPGTPVGPGKSGGG